MPKTKTKQELPDTVYDDYELEWAAKQALVPGHIAHYTRCRANGDRQTITLL